MAHLKELLTSSDSATLVGSVALFVFGTIYCWRKFLPASWLWIEDHLELIRSIENTSVSTFVWKAAQAIPGTLIGALIPALLTGGDLKKTLLGALAGPVAAIGHELIRRYKGAIPAVLVAVLLLSAPEITGCGLKGVAWPAVAQCVPAPTTLLSQVGTVLFAGDDYKSALEQIAEKDGAAAVSCAVKQLVDELGAPTAKRSTKSDAARARGARFLLETGTDFEPAE